ERAGDEDVAELVGQHAGEQEEHERESAPGRVRAARGPARNENPGEKEHEGKVDADRRAGDRTDVHGPGHAASSSRARGPASGAVDEIWLAGRQCQTARRRGARSTNTPPPPALCAPAARDVMSWGRMSWGRAQTEG